MRPKAIIATALLWLVASAWPAAPARAQAPGDAGEPVARKFDEYINLFNSCNAGAYLDNFAIELQNTDGLKGHIIIYGPGGADDGFGRRAADVTRDYLVNTRGLEGSRLKVVYGGRSRSGRELLTELWVVPEGARPPAAAAREGDAAPFEGKFAEVGLWEGFGTSDVVNWCNEREVTLVGFSDLLRRQPDARAYIVAFHDEASPPGAWRRVAADSVDLLGRNGVGAGRVEVIFGGYRKEAVAELWVLPRSAPPPAAAAPPERRPKAAARVGMFEHYELSDEGRARRAFEGFAEVLKADAEVTAYVIVHLPFAGAPEGDEAAAAARAVAQTPDPDAPPDINLAQLADQWKRDLKRRYGIGEQRLVLVFVPSQESWNSDRLETWIVPHGAAPPDPYADEGGQLTEAEQDNPKEF